MALPGTEFIRRERARVRHFLGLDLPERTLRLGFDLLRLRRCRDRPPANPGRLQARLQASRTTPTEQLEAMLTLVLGLKRCPMPERRRFQLVEALAAWFHAEAAPQIAALAAEGGGIPEQGGRGVMLDLLARNTQTLIDVYQLIFATDYARNRFWYAKVRSRVHHCAHRIMELIKLQHRIVGIRYAPLPAQSWRLANTIYVVMRAYESTDVPTETLAAVSPGALPSRRLANLDQLYGSLQTYHILDYSAWPEQNQFFIDTYCNAVDGGIRIHDHRGTNLVAAKDTLLTAYRHDAPATRTLPNGAELGPALIIDYRTLADSIRLDYVELSKARADRNRFAMPSRLAVLEPVHQTATGYLLYRNLRLPGLWGDLSSARQRYRDLRIYVGYEEVRAHLLAIFSAGDGRPQSRELSDLFARRSAIIGEDDTSTQESRWYVLYESAERMRIKTQETRFTHRMFIGNLLAYGFGRKGAQNPRIGKVNRLYRPEAGAVVIDVEYLASFGTPITLHRRDPGGDAEPRKLRVIGEPLPSLLIHHPKRGWGVVTPPQEGFWEQTPVGIQSGRQVRLGRLGEAQDVTAEFHWFAIAQANFPDQLPTYPETADAAEEAAEQELPDVD
jgi:hypothetical protein